MQFSLSSHLLNLISSYAAQLETTARIQRENENSQANTWEAGQFEISSGRNMLLSVCMDNTTSD